MKKSVDVGKATVSVHAGVGKKVVSIYAYRAVLATDRSF